MKLYLVIEWCIDNTDRVDSIWSTLELATEQVNSMLAVKRPWRSGLSIDIAELDKPYPEREFLTAKISRGIIAMRD